ncbi:MAG: hypothetical protein IPK18_09105 [Sphingobacteriales bacterium]|jgi:hypothetical protein|nr:MAG: hypothetical protein IPK18_09105 [Sphingobacteriales bacterium]
MPLLINEIIGIRISEWVLLFILILFSVKPSILSLLYENKVVQHLDELLSSWLQQLFSVDVHEEQLFASNALLKQI